MLGSVQLRRVPPLGSLARGLLVLLVTVLVARSAHATLAQQRRGHDTYLLGEAAFKRGEYQVAFDHFREAYLLAPLPEILYNMASAQEALGRPGEAADGLRAYLRASQDRAERIAIESRIRGLDEAQRLLDVERLKREGPKLLAVPATDQRAARRTRLVIGLSVTAGILVAGGVAFGLGFGLRPQHTDSTLQTQRATP